jgi:hypothetical protein
LLLDATRRAEALHAQGHYQESLDICLQIMRDYRDALDAVKFAATNCIRLGRWQDAIGYAQTWLGRGGKDNTFGYDTLAFAHGQLKQWGEARRYGLQALEMRARLVSDRPTIPQPNLRPLPPLPSTQTREHNVISFSLFGGNSKYCEPAILNVQEQPQIYPHWVCRFYVDGSVPENVVSRLQASGGQIVRVQGSAAQWPGPMWRFLALDDPRTHRVLFRDADSVISQREAHAVEQWLSSGRRFHTMRDAGGHTELMLAGLWGAVSGSLPPLEKLIERFMSTPLNSQHFADQDFLRQYIWPYARNSLMQHDSVFGFMDAVPFPDDKIYDAFHVGHVESSSFFIAKSNLPNGAKITWELYQVVDKSDNGLIRGNMICSYASQVNNGTVSAHIPERYAQWIQQGTACVRLIDNTKQKELE